MLKKTNVANEMARWIFFVLQLISGNLKLHIQALWAVDTVYNMYLKESECENAAAVAVATILAYILSDRNMCQKRCECCNMAYAQRAEKKCA